MNLLTVNLPPLKSLVNIILLKIITLKETKEGVIYHLEIMQQLSTTSSMIIPMQWNLIVLLITTPL